MTYIGEKENINVENIFEAIYNDSPIGIELFNSDGKLYKVNNSCMELFGVVNKDELMGFDLFNDPNIPLEYISQLKQRKTVRYESKFDFDLVKSQKFYETTKSGKIFIDVLITPLYLENNNKISNYLVQVQDITDSKTVEQKLKDSEKKYRTMINNLDIGFYKVRIDGTYVNHNPEHNRILGIDPSKSLKGEKTVDFWQNIEDRSKYLKDLSNNGFIRDYIVHAKKINGEKIVLQANTHLIKDAGGQNVAVEGSFIDITEKFKIQEELKDSKERLKELNKSLEQKAIERTAVLKDSEEEFRMLFENANDAIFLHDISDEYIPGKFIKVNEKACQLYGYNRDEMLELTPYDLADPNHLEDLLEIPNKLLKKGNLTFEAIDRTKKGKSFRVEASSHIFRLNGKNMALTIVRDVTERKKAVEALKESEVRFRSTFEQAAVGIAHTAIDGTFLRVNQRLCDIVKFSREEMLNLTFQDITHPEDLEADLDFVAQVLDDTIQTFSMEKRYICKDNSVVWVNLTGSLVRELSGEPKYFIAVIEDINEKKLAEQKLIISEEKYKTLSKEMEMILDHLPGPVFFKDAQNHFLRVNKFLAEAHNLSKEELRGKSLFELYSEQEAQAYWDDDLEVIKSGEPKLNIVESWYTKEGRKWVLTSKIPFVNEEGNITGIIGLSSDITDQKKMEDVIRISERKLKTLMEAVPIGISISNPEGIISDINSEALRLFGYASKEEMLQTPAKDFYYFEEDGRHFVELLEKNGFVKDFEFLSQRVDGTTIWLSMNSASQIIGEELMYINSFQDITERKEKEDELRLHSEIMTNISEGVFLIRIVDGIIVYANPALEEMFGYNPGEMIDQNVAIVNAPTDKT
ncbi:hypothetical protein LCGC14_1743180, partial [marine sediment metagenome]